MSAAPQIHWTLAAVEGGTEALPQTGFMLTCSHSATILRSLTLAVGNGKDLTALAHPGPTGLSTVGLAWLKPCVMRVLKRMLSG